MGLQHSIRIGKNGSSRKIQDTPKQSNILCTACEQRISVIEGYFARTISAINNFSDFPDEFKLVGNTRQTQYIECTNIHPSLFKLFIYTLIWRASISTLPEFQKYKLSQAAEEKIRQFLDVNLKIDHRILLESMESTTNIPDYDMCFVKPFQKSENTRGVFTAYNIDESRHFLLLIDFAVFFFSENNLIDPLLKVVNNRQNEKVLIGLGENKAWTALNQKVVEQMLQQKN